MNKDIRREMLLALPNIKEILNYCAVDTLSRTICSEPYYWRQLFDQYNLPFPNHHYTDPKSWALAFEKERVIAHNVRYFINLLYTRPIILDVYVNPSFFDILKVDGIDLTDLLIIENSFILRILKGTAHPSDCIAQINAINDIYTVDIFYGPHLPNFYDYDITKEAVEQILYNMLSRGIKPLTVSGFNMGFVKL